MSYYDPESRWAHLSTKPGSDLLHQPLPADWRHLLSVEQLHELMTVIAQAVRIIDIQYIPTLPNYADIAYEILQQQLWYRNSESLYKPGAEHLKEEKKHLDSLHEFYRIYQAVPLDATYYPNRPSTVLPGYTSHYLATVLLSTLGRLQEPQAGATYLGTVRSMQDMEEPTLFLPQLAVNAYQLLDEIYDAAAGMFGHPTFPGAETHTERLCNFFKTKLLHGNLHVGLFPVVSEHDQNLEAHNYLQLIYAGPETYRNGMPQGKTLLQ